MFEHFQMYTDVNDQLRITISSSGGDCMSLFSLESAFVSMMWLPGMNI